jgi:hypothetical protein
MITKAFRALRKKGYIAKQNFMCCQSCALAELPEGTEKYVFYHRQDNTQLIRTGSCHLAWGGDGKAIVDVLEAEGLLTSWDGSPHSRILIAYDNECMKRAL